MRTQALLAALACGSFASANMFVKRDSWGPAVGLGPAKQEIISTTTTVYPGSMPASQAGYLFVWLGISNGTGDLVQSIIGSYPKGGSECSGADADTAWCISSEVYGLAANGYPNQWVGTQTTAFTNYQNGITLNYTLTDKSTYTWTQTMSDAKTGALLSSYSKASGPMLGWGTAIECNDNNGVACTGTVASQTWVNSTIILEAADSTFSNTLGASNGATNSEMVTADGGKTWTIAEISIPAMKAAAGAVNGVAPAADTAASAVSSVASVAKAATSTVAAVATSAAKPVTTSVAKPVTTIAVNASTTTTKAAATTSKHHGHQGTHRARAARRMR